MSLFTFVCLILRQYNKTSFFCLINTFYQAEVKKTVKRKVEKRLSLSVQPETDPPNGFHIFLTACLPQFPPQMTDMRF